MVRLAQAAAAASKLTSGRGPLFMISSLTEKAAEREQEERLRIERLAVQRQFAGDQRAARIDLSRDARGEGGFEAGGGDDEWEDVEDVSGSAQRAAHRRHLTERRHLAPSSLPLAEAEARRPRWRPALNLNDNYDTVLEGQRGERLEREGARLPACLPARPPASPAPPLP